MGRPPTHGAPSFRFHAAEVGQMESILREHAGHVPPRELLVSLATKFSNSPERAGKSIVQMKQVWNWFQNRRYALRSKLVKSPGNPNMPPNPQGEVAPVRNVPPVHQQTPVPSGHNLVRNTSENSPMEFEAKSARDGAWYDVQAFLSHRYLETGNPEVLVRFAGFGQEEDEWINVRKHVRQRSLPCESSECIVVLPGDLILCFQEGKEQALYFDAHVLDAQRRRHDVRGCRCRFLVRYDHDKSEEIVPLRKVCRRPETDYRLQLLHSTNESASASSSLTADSKKPAVDPASTSSSRVSNPSSCPVAFPSHTIVNSTAGVPHPALSAATTLASTSAPAVSPSLTPFSAPTQSLTSASAPAPNLAPSQVQVQVQAQAPVPPQVQAPAPALAAASAQAPTLEQTPGPALAPHGAQAPALEQTAGPAPELAPHGAPASVTTPYLTSISVPTPSLTPISAPTPSSIPVSAPTQLSTPIPAPDPSLTAISSSIQSLIPTVISGPAPVSAPTPSPTQILAPTTTMISTSSPTPVLVHSSIPVGAPEAKKIKCDNPATSLDGEASTRESITNSSATSVIMEVNKEENSILGTSTALTGGSDVSQRETSDSTAVTTVISPEKVESIIAPSEPMEVSTAPMEGGPSVSTVVESSNVDDAKEVKADNR